jgi:hypothetical protein
VVGDVAQLLGGAEEDDANVTDLRSTARDLSGTDIRPVDVDRDGDLAKVG